MFFNFVILNHFKSLTLGLFYILLHGGWTHRAISRSSQWSTTGVTKAVVCAILTGMVHIKEPLLLIGKSNSCGDNRFSLSLSEWSCTICPTHKMC